MIQVLHPKYITSSRFTIVIRVLVIKNERSSTGENKQEEREETIVMQVMHFIIYNMGIIASSRLMDVTL
jgi:hypothetical protein